MHRLMSYFHWSKPEYHLTYVSSCTCVYTHMYVMHVSVHIHVRADEFCRGMVEEYYNLNITEQLCR